MKTQTEKITQKVENEKSIKEYSILKDSVGEILNNPKPTTCR